MSYDLEIKDNVLVFRTASFKAEGKSFLHSGIFNRELAASLASGAAIIAFGFFFAAYSKIKAVHLPIAVLLFGALFIIFRLFVFGDAILETIFDREKGTITITKKRAIGGKTRARGMKELTDIRVNRIAAQPLDPDAVKFVEKIALQHGTVIPGFGKALGLTTVGLGFRDGKEIAIFSSKNEAEAEDIVNKIRNFIKEEDLFFVTSVVEKI